MISAQQFLNLLEDRRLVPAKALKSLRRQVAASTQAVPASKLAWLLVENGYLDRATAQEVLGEPLPEAPPPSRPQRWPRPGTPKSDQSAAEGGLGLAPLDEGGEDVLLPLNEGPKPLGLAPLDSEDELLPLDDDRVPAGETRAFDPLTDIAPDESLLVPIDEADELLPLEEPPARPATTTPRRQATSAPPASTAPTPTPPAPTAPAQKPPGKVKPAAASPSSVSEALDALAPSGSTTGSSVPTTQKAVSRGTSPSPGATPRGAPPAQAAPDLLDDAIVADQAAGPLATAAPRQSTVKGLFGRRGRRRSDQRWDSGTLLISGGALLGLIILGAALAWALTRESGDERLRIADEFYDQGSYTQAIANYDVFLRKFPTHAGVSLARVRRGLCRMRQTVGNASRDWVLPLKTAEDVLAEIASEPEFKEARPELAAILPSIAEGLAGQAQKENHPQRVEQTRTALAMVDKYVPKSLRPTVRLADVEASLAVTEREIARGSELDRAVAGIQQAIEQQITPRAYEIRSQLLKQYPDLAANERLVAAILAVSQAEKAAVKSVTQEQAAVAEPPTSVALATLALGHASVSGTAPGVDGHVVFASAGGGLYALDAASGQLLWRRFLGFDDGAGRSSPLPLALGNQPAADVLMVAPADRELRRIRARTGEIVWRHQVADARFSWPILNGAEILLSTESGRILQIAAESGVSSGFVQLPQQLRVEPTVDSLHGLLFQVADHSNLFVLSLDKKDCREVYYLGHERGSIVAPPIVISNYLILAENTGLETATLRVFGIGVEEGKLLSPLQQIRVQGVIDMPPLVASPRVLVTTDQGKVYLYDVRGEDPKAPLHQVADTTLEGGPQVIRYPLAGKGAFLVADRQLTKFEIQASRGRLVPQWIRDEHSAFVQPLAAIGDVVYHVRTPDGLRGLVVSATDVNEGAKLWETFVAAPLVATPRIDADGASLTAVASSGSVFRLTADQLQGDGATMSAVAAFTPSDLVRAVEGETATSEGAIALSTGRGAQRIAVLFRGDADRFRWLTLPDPAAAPPVGLGQGVLVPVLSGQVFLLDAQTNQKLTEPFQPQLGGPQPVAWTRPQPLGTDRFVIGDGDRRVFLVGIKPEPKPHLAALAQRSLSDRLVAAPVVLGEVVYVLDQSATLSAFALPDLADRKQLRLTGRLTWGPLAAGDRLLIATSDEKLTCVGPDQEIAWQVALPYGPPVGEPLVAGADIVLAAARGVLWRMEAASGKELGKVDVGQPLGTGPVAFRGRLLAGSGDGSLVEVVAP